MNREETKEAIKVMQHYADGGEVEYRSCDKSDWSFDDSPWWNWISYTYRIKQTPKKVKLYAHLDAYGLLFWCSGELVVYQRVPSEDKEVEIEE